MFLLFELGSLVSPLISAVVASAGLFVTINIYRRQKRHEFAERIKDAAGEVTSKLMRRKKLSLHFFDSVQPLFVTVDQIIVKERDVVAARDTLWRDLVAALAATSKNIVDEKIEIAFKGLFGYDPRIEELYAGAIQRLEAIDKYVYGEILRKTQFETVLLSSARREILSAELGNRLRTVCEELAQETEQLIDGIISPFKTEMVRLARASNKDIAKRKIEIAQPNDILPTPPKPRLVESPQTFQSKISESWIAYEKSCLTLANHLNHVSFMRIPSSIITANDSDSRKEVKPVLNLRNAAMSAMAMQVEKPIWVSDVSQIRGSDVSQSVLRDSLEKYSKEIQMPGTTPHLLGLEEIALWCISKPLLRYRKEPDKLKLNFGALPLSQLQTNQFKPPQTSRKQGPNHQKRSKHRKYKKGKH